MLTYKMYLALVGLVLATTGLISACQATPTLVAPSAPGISVGITSDTCPDIVVYVGQQVTWINQDTREHIVRHKPGEGESQFDSGTLQPGDSFALTLPQPGIYPYECLTDGSMMGTVTVQQ